MNAMQVFALRQTKAAYYFDVAMNQVNNLNERLTAIKNHPIDLEPLLSVWNKENHTVLPDGRGMIDTHDSLFAIKVFWGTASTVDSSCQQNKIGLSGCYGERISALF